MFITYEILTNGYEPIYLDGVSILAIISGIFVIITKNPVISVLFLIGLFVNIDKNVGNSYLWSRAKFRENSKDLVTKVDKETRLAWCNDSR